MKKLLTPGWRYHSTVRATPNPIEVELAGEQAAALGRSGRRLRAALEKLRRFDAGKSGVREPADAATRKELVELAGEALWSYVVQRESLGLYDADTITRDYSVPAEVQKSMGPRIAAASPRRGRR
jgi:hypothetical protein